MNRTSFLTTPRVPVFNPSVREVWKNKVDGREILLYSTYEPEGFHCVGYNHDCTLNFNYLPDDWIERNEYVKTLTDYEMQEVIREKKERGWL